MGTSRPGLTWTVYVLFILLLLGDMFVTIASRATTLYGNRQWLLYNEGELEQPWLTTVPGTLTVWQWIDYIFHFIRILALLVIAYYAGKVYLNNAVGYKLVTFSENLLMALFSLISASHITITLIVSYSPTPWESSVWVYAVQTLFAGSVFLVYIITSNQPQTKSDDMKRLVWYQVNATWLWFPWILFTLADASIRSVSSFRNSVDEVKIQQVVTPILLIGTFVLVAIFFFMWKFLTRDKFGNDPGSASVFSMSYIGGMEFYAASISSFLYVTGVGLYIVLTTSIVNTTTTIVLCTLCTAFLVLLLFVGGRYDTGYQKESDATELETIQKRKRRVL